MARQWRCANGHTWTGEIGALTFCPDCNSQDVYEVRGPGLAHETLAATESSGASFSQSLRQRRKKNGSPPRAASPVTASHTTLVQSPPPNELSTKELLLAPNTAPAPGRSDATMVQPDSAKDAQPEEVSTQEFPALSPGEQSTVVVPPMPAKPPGDTMICDASCFTPAPVADQPTQQLGPSTCDFALDEPAASAANAEQQTPVEAAVSGQPDHSTVLASPDSAVRRGNGSPGAEKPGQGRTGKPVGRDGFPDVAGYEILGVLGRGGMGVVYKARQRGLNRLVALKMILGGAHAGQGERGRFQTEALAVAKLQHPNIVQVYEVGERDGLPFFSLEYIAGGSLSERTEDKPLAPRVAATLVELLARAMQYAHSNGIVHRDLKPANILLKDRDGDETKVDSGADPSSVSGPQAVRLPYTPKITDFGLAKDLRSDSDLTGTGAILGTPSFMSPEQAGGKTRAIGPPTDIHALGAILYDALTGRPPFLGADPMATIVQVRTMEPAPPSRWQPDLPRDLETICLKCLEKAPARRYASAGELADDLRRFLENEPIRARPASLFEKAWKWSRRQPTSAALIALSVVTLIGAAIAGGTIAKLKWQQADAELARAEQERELRAQAEASAARAQRESARAQANFEAARDAMDAFLARVGDQRFRADPRTERLQAQLLDSALDFYDRFLRADDGADPALRREAGWAYQRAGRIREMQGRRKEAIAAYQEAGRLFAALSQQEPAEPRNRQGHAESLRQLASAFEADNQRAQADAAHADALALLEGLVAEAPGRPDHRVTLASLRNSRAAHLAQRGQVPEAVALFRAALTGLAGNDPAAPREVQFESAKTEIKLAGVLIDANRHDEGRAALESGIGLLRQLTVNFKDPLYARELGRGLDALGSAYRQLHQTEPALAAYREAAAIFARLAAEFPRSPDYAFWTASAYDNIAGTLEAGANLRAGAADRDKARSIYRRLATNYPLNDEYRQRFAKSLEIQGEYYLEFGQLNDAMTAVSEAVTLLERLAAENPNNAVIQQQYGHSLVSLGNLQIRADAVAKAEANLIRAAAVLESVLHRSPTFDAARQSLIAAYRNQANILQNTGRTADADAAWSRVMNLQIKRAADFPDQPDLSADVAKSLSALAELRQDKPIQRLTALRGAYDHQKTALKLAPHRADLFANLGVYGIAAVETLSHMSDFAGACAAANRVAADMPPNWPGLLKLAQTLSQCTAAARDDKKLSDADRAKVVRNCGDEALSILRRAVAGGFRDAAALQTAPEFKSLRDAEEFKDGFAQIVQQIR